MTDNGFLKLDNSIIDYWMAKLNHSEFKTLLAIYRKTVGWSKQYDRITQSQLSELTGLTTRSVGSAINSLESIGIVITAGKDKTVKVFSLNLNKLYSVCLKPDEVVELEAKLEDIAKTTEINTLKYENNSQDFDLNFVHKRHPKDTNNKKVKETVVPDINIPFDVFWDLYDYKKNKSDCLAKWHSMTNEERQLTMDNLDSYIKSTPNKAYRKYPLNYLENECWNDEIVLVDKEIAHNTNDKNTNHSNNVFSASHKEFEPIISLQEVVQDADSTKHTKDDLECNLEALGISSVNSTVVNTTDTINNDTTVDIVALSSQIHWSELKARGMLKNPVNTNAVIPNTDTDKKINEFLARNSSKRFCKDIS